MPRVSYQKSASQKLTTAVVEDVVAEHGVHAALPSLLETVRVMCEISMADPGNREKLLRYKRWAKATKAICNRPPATFEQRLSESDAILARGMGIRLD